ncbi:MAG: hypothetical protein HYZ26_00280 [Chloroflexi bacterium]|nr:hypothetical protein [Chloroflexota bacterium]
MRRFNWRDPSLRIGWIIFLCVALYIYYTARLGAFKAEDIIFTLYGLLLFQPHLVNANVVALGVDLFFLAAGSVVWIAFFGQFVLPVRTVQERAKIIDRLLYTLGRGQGPAILIQNGQIIDNSTEEQKRGAGVILLDSASAAVLHNQSSFTQAVGPGLVFTERGEFIFSPVDLRIQMRRIGPLEDDPDPEGPEAKDASEEDREAWRERRKQTSGMTRDGVEVIPQILAIFRLRANPGEGNTRFGYRQDSVWRAVAHQGIDPQAPQDAESRLVAWDWLPVQMAADLWREYLRKYTFTELFEFPPFPVQIADGQTEPYKRSTILETIVQQINARLKQDLIEVFDEVGRPTGRKQSSRERFLLLQRGLDVIAVSVGNLQFSKDPVEKSLIERWPNTWMLRARDEERIIEQQRAIQKSRGQQQAEEQFAALVSRPLYRRILPRPESEIPEPSLHEALELLVQGTLDSIRTSPELLPQLNDVEAELNEIKDWLRLARNGSGAQNEVAEDG